MKCGTIYLSSSRLPECTADVAILPEHILTEAPQGPAGQGPAGQGPTGQCWKELSGNNKAGVMKN